MGGEQHLVGEAVGRAAQCGNSTYKRPEVCPRHRTFRQWKKAITAWNADGG